MLRSLLLLLSSSVLSLSALAQTAPASTQAPAQPSVPTLKANARLVVVDVVVTDKNQNPVHNLKQSDFTLFEANAPQTVRHFEEHIYPDPHATAAQVMPRMPPGTFTNYSSVPPSSSLTVLLLDTLNTPLADQVYVRDQLKKYLKSAQPGARVAIFGLTSRLTMLQGFTSDPELLKAVIEKKNARSSPLLDDPNVQSVYDQMTEISGGDPSSAQVLANLQQFEAQEQSFQLQLRAKYTLDAMNLLARYLSALPGRKNLIWFSGSFPISILPDGDLQDPFAVVGSSEEEFRQTTDLLTASQVAVYPVDARGLMTSPNLSAANSGSKYVRNPRAFGNDETKFFQQTAAEHGTMLQMAEQTGGHAFVNTNGLSQAIATAINSGSNYYTLTYSPTDTNYNGKFRKIQVRLQQQGFNLAYRRGYYATNPTIRPAIAKAQPGSSPNPNEPPPPDPMRAAMLRGAPSPSQILFKVQVLPAAATPENALAPGNAANPKSKSAQGPYRRYQIDLAALPHDILFTRTTDGLLHGALQLFVYTYDLEGTVITEDVHTSNATLNTADAKRLLEGGIQLQEQISVPVKGNYFLRIGIHDLVSDRIGAVEIPVAAVKNLPPLPVSNPPNPPSPTTPPTQP